MIHEHLEFLTNLLKCRSITPQDNGAIDVVIAELTKLGFKCNKLVFAGDGEAEVTNLYAEYGEGDKNLCFAGHTDVVPEGDTSAWKYDPFSACIDEGKIYARGAVDMKGAISSFIYATKKYIEANPDSSKYKLSFLLSGNEEGNPINGTPKVLDWILKNKTKITTCIVGEPTNDNDITRIIKIGRRGSINFTLVLNGVQGHVAYPQNCHNPINDMINILRLLKNKKLDNGSEFFDPSNLEVTSIDVANASTNVIPSRVSAKFNIRFNDAHNFASLEALIRSTINQVTESYTLTVSRSGESFYNKNREICGVFKEAIEQTTGREVIFSTSGGISDARFIKDMCPVIEYGLKNTYAHQVNEYTTISELEELTLAYHNMITKFFNN